MDLAGKIFISTLQLFAVPLVFFSMVVSMRHIETKAQLLRIGIFVFIMYILTTLLSVSLGLFLGNICKPGVVFRKFVHLTSLGGLNVQQNVSTLPPDTSQNIFPPNFFALLSSNKYLPFIVIAGVAFGFSLLENKEGKLLFDVCEGIRASLSKVLSYIIKLAPIGGFCLIASQLITILKDHSTSIQGIFIGIGFYMGTVIFGLTFMLFIVYPSMVKLFSKKTYRQFVQTMRPAQLLAFSTSSSTATLAKSKEQVAHLGVSEKIRSFVLSLGAPINMDGTALYQGLVAIFITQLFGYNLAISQQFYIAGYITILSMGVAGVPGGSLVTTSMLLETLVKMNILTLSQIPLALGILYIADNFLDRMRTVANVTGDLAVAVLTETWEERHKDQATNNVAT